MDGDKGNIKVVDDILEHYGMKGMRWGIRKEYVPVSSGNRKSTQISGSNNFSKTQAVSMNNIAQKMNKAYGLKIDEFKPLESRLEKKAFAYVESTNNGKNVVHVTTRSDVVKKLQECEKDGWLIPSIEGREIESLLTHETAHTLFHSVNVEGMGAKERWKARESMNSMRKSAWQKAEEQARKDGDVKSKRFRPDFPMEQLNKKISKYASSSLFIEEAEAEMFSAYHWSPKPPKFIDTFYSDIHSQMGINVQPFSGRKVSHVS
jgi:hypothetical protein